MEGTPDDFGPYRLLAGGVVPRPIAWVSSRSTDGVDNLAPYSFFNVVAYDPPVVMFAPVGVGEDLKDTPRNILDTEEFVVNVVTEDLVEAMNATSATLDDGESEFDHADLEKVEATTVDVARVADAKVAFECELYDSMEVGSSTMILGEVVYAHVADGVTTPEGKLDVNKLDVVGRLSGGGYTRTRDRFSLERPP
ncbi:NADH-FMN oxidoreductase RutF, flavin reductase (DIM6/NTAB) family [Halogranum gelatinilyticum]|uniref:NADH-FMN oxidoreductase RutF, flavin reductase (DIM6/NTAB) family n=1 Tax=Halogranum gelatinilyticum TaxID=660521 RepID=A0A1G9ZZ25_9EURY|nr:flavin reductase family protein [Halogranum gelatinilyticum]SDN26385.1 NADH-FMN oxidoreductase RutF, flavin reductase (DIM6/NTAB) family [Halogranum gelatinilyticum]